MFITTKALVLREARYRDADKILTVLTESEGKLTVKARGTLRKSSRTAAAAQALCYSEMTLFGNRGRWTLNEAATIEQFVSLREDLTALALGTYFAEALELLSDEDSPNPEILRLGLNALYALSRELYPQEHIKAVFELRLMGMAGFGPDTGSCAVCRREEPLEPMFSLSGGVLTCAACPRESGAKPVRLLPETLRAMRFISGAELKRVFSFSLSKEGGRQLAHVAEEYMAAQLERGFSALDYWKKLRAIEQRPLPSFPAG